MRLHKDDAGTTSSAKGGTVSAERLTTTRTTAADPAEREKELR
jgi:hypothetical protein